jgi:hypothetical protein
MEQNWRERERFLFLGSDGAILRYRLKQTKEKTTTAGQESSRVET